MSTEYSDEPAAMSVLVVEDEAAITALIETVLAAEGFKVQLASDLASARTALSRYEPDIVLIDLGLPDGSGLDLLAEIRQRPDQGLLVVSGSGDEIDTLVGFQMGADDYVTKPFRPRELVARVRAVSRRLVPAIQAYELDLGSIIRFGAFRADMSAGWVCDADDRRIDLTTSEFELLRVFLRHRGETLSRDRLNEEIKGGKAAFNGRLVDGLVSRLRRKLSVDRDTPLFIRTVHGCGYSFVA